MSHNTSKKTLHTLGILGGMGPYSTMYFYQKLLSKIRTEKDQEHIPTIIYSNTKIIDREQAFRSRNPYILEQLIDSIQILEKAGADKIVITCNTAHYWFNEIKKNTNVPLYNLIDSTLEYLSSKNLLDAILLATETTYVSNIYKASLSCSSKLKIIYPDKEIVNELRDLIKKVKTINNFDNQVNQISKIIFKLTEELGVSTIILGCTELSMISNNICFANIVDPLDITIDIICRDFNVKTSTTPNRSYPLKYESEIRDEDIKVTKNINI